MPGTVRAPHEKLSIMLTPDRGVDLSRRQFLLAAGASERRRVFISGASGAAHRRRQARIVFPEVGSARRTLPWRPRSRRLDRFDPLLRRAREQLLAEVEITDDQDVRELRHRDRAYHASK